MVFGPFFLPLDTLGQARTLLPQLCFPNRAELANLGQLLPRFPASSSRLQYQMADQPNRHFHGAGRFIGIQILT